MKKRLLLVAVIVLIVASVFCGCDNHNDDLPQATLTVRSPYDVQGVTLYAEEIETFDFTKVFLLRNEEREFTVEQSYLDKSGLTSDGGTVKCIYGEQTAQVTVTVATRAYELNLLQNFVEMYVADAAKFDAKSMFLAKIDGVKADITDDMVTTDFKAEAGNYKYTVNFHGVSQTLNIRVNDEIVIKPVKANYVSLGDIDVTAYDYASLFTITVNGVKIAVKKEYVDASQAVVGKSLFTVICSYGGQECKIDVSVKAKMYTVSLAKDKIVLHVSKAADYDFNALFTVTLNSKKVDITGDMVVSTVKAQVGNYEYTVTAGLESKTLSVEVTNVHQVEALVNYPDLELEAENAVSFDCTRLFSLYVDGDAVRVTANMLDKTTLSDVAVGKKYEVTLTYSDADGRVTSKKATVSIVETSQVRIVGTNVVTYPNSEPIDLKTLFTITHGDQIIPVTDDMISGSVNYSASGDNVVTAEYGGITQTATVTVKRGIVINTKANVITVKQGTDIEKYFFENDFTVIVNGIKIDHIAPYLDISELNFTKEGEYKAKITVPYGEKETSGLENKSELTYHTAEITYKVEKNTYGITLGSSTVSVTKNASFDPLANINVVINGLAQALTTNPAYVDAISCYAKVVKGVDTSVIGKQTVTVEVYVNGVDGEPQIVTYGAEVISDVTATAVNKAVFVGATLYTRDLFTVKRGGSEIEVTEDMVSGHVDVFTVGSYVVRLIYEGLNVEARVTVVDSALRGTYSTLMTTVVSEDEEDSEGWVTEGEKSRVYGDMTLYDDFTVKMDDKTGTFAGVDEDGNLTFMMATMLYTMHWYDGVVVMNPDNSLNMGYTNYKRPFVYIKNDLWRFNTNGKIILNSSKSGQHVVGQESSSIYTIEIFRVTSRKDVSQKVNFALKIRLVSKMTSGFYYDLSWGEASFNEGFAQTNGEKGVLSYNSENYSFVMHGPVSARLEQTSDETPFAGTTFRRSANDSKNTLFVASNGQITYKENNINVFTPVTKAEMGQMKNGGIDAVNNTIFVYKHDGSGYDKQFYSYKFKVDPQTKLYQLLEKDSLFGLYVLDNMFIFLDGYGTGLMSLNSSSYYEYQLKYEVVNGEVNVDFVNVYGDGNIGKTATFYVADTLNILTCKSADNADIVGKRFVNKHIFDGAIIYVDQSVLHSGSTSDDFVNAVTVITKNGEMSVSEKKACISKTVGYNQSGVYQFTVTVTVGGVKLNAYFGVQIVVPLDPVPALAGTYQSVIRSGYVLKLDGYGFATLTSGETEYVGNVAYYDGGRFVARVKSGSKQCVVAGKSFADGTLEVTCNGAVNFADYMTAGVSAASGNGSCVLRRITVNGADTYVWCKTVGGLGEKVVPVLIGGNQYRIPASDGEAVVKINNWNGVKDSLEVADSVRGTYAGGGKEMFLDGFGSVSLAGQSGTYKINANKTVSVKINGKLTVYSLDTEEKSFEAYDITLNETLLQGVRLSAQFNFFCNEEMYSATTLFVFGSDGKVIVYSSSDGHDKGDGQCSLDKYSPPYSVAGGAAGTFQVNGDAVTVSVRGCTFTFEIADVTNVNKMTCLFTSVDSDAHGYFAVGTVFGIPVSA